MIEIEESIGLIFVNTTCWTIEYESEESTEQSVLLAKTAFFIAFGISDVRIFHDLTLSQIKEVFKELSVELAEKSGFKGIIVRWIGWDI